MPITHAAVSPIPDSGDPDWIQPSEWNADHVVVDLTDAEVAAANKDGAAGTPSMRTLGAGATQAAAGNHAHAGVYSPVGHTHAQADVASLVADLATLADAISDRALAVRSISTTAPLSGGGDMTSDRTLSVATFGAAQAGVVPASGGGAINFLRADGTWSAPAGGGGGGLSHPQAMARASYGA